MFRPRLNWLQYTEQGQVICSAPESIKRHLAEGIAKHEGLGAQPQHTAFSGSGMLDPHTCRTLQKNAGSLEIAHSLSLSPLLQD